MLKKLLSCLSSNKILTSTYLVSKGQLTFELCLKIQTIPKAQNSNLTH